MSEKVELVEVSPRDGLQNEASPVGTEDKLGLIDRARRAGLDRIEVTSFVNPKKVPQMADADAVMSGVRGREDILASVLALNLRGVDRGLEAGAREINYVIIASDEFSIRNNGAPTLDTLKMWPEVVARVRGAGARLGFVLGASFGCPFEGEVPVARIAMIAERIAAHAPDEFALADTIGVGVPADVKARFAAVSSILPATAHLRAHFHNTRNTGVANALAAYEAGVKILDSSLGGIGGCPFAPGAAGNVATEDLVYMFERSGIATGVDLDAAIEAANWITGRLGRQATAMVSRAPPFPRRAPSAAAA
jgi:hydroxymethylglutaryl-CoA lyase